MKFDFKKIIELIKNNISQQVVTYCLVFIAIMMFLYFLSDLYERNFKIDKISIPPKTKEEKKPITYSKIGDKCNQEKKCVYPNEKIKQLICIYQNGLAKPETKKQVGICQSRFSKLNGPCDLFNHRICYDPESNNDLICIFKNGLSTPDMPNELGNCYRNLLSIKTKDKAIKENKKDPAYLGCFVDKFQHVFNKQLDDDEQLTPLKCIMKCREQGYKFAAVQFNNQCFCGSSDEYRLAKRAPEKECNTPCKGDDKLICGGPWRNSVYVTNVIEKKN